MKIGVLGSGGVAKTLASGFLKHGHETMLASGTPGKLAEWAVQNPDGAVGSFAETAAFAETIVLAVKGKAAAEVLSAAGTGNLAGKTVIDACNPIEDAPPVNGVLRFFTTFDESLMEGLQLTFEKADFVKAFNSVRRL